MLLRILIFGNRLNLTKRFSSFIVKDSLKTSNIMCLMQSHAMHTEVHVSQPHPSV